MAGDDVLPPGGYRVDRPVWEPWSPADVQVRQRVVAAPWYFAHAPDLGE